VRVSDEKSLMGFGTGLSLGACPKRGRVSERAARQM